MKIINSVIFGDDKFCKYNKLDKLEKNEWIAKFIKNENFISQILEQLSKVNLNENNESNVSSIIQIIINWFLNIFNKIKDYYKNQIILINDEESESNYNILEENKIEQKLKKNEISTKANEANKENKGNNTDEYEIDENQANNFIIILEKNKFIKKLYGILTVILNSSIAKAKYYNNNIIENIYDIITEYIKIKPKEIEYFLEEEKPKKNNNNFNYITSTKNQKVFNEFH